MANAGFESLTDWAESGEDFGNIELRLAVKPLLNFLPIGRICAAYLPLSVKSWRGKKRKGKELSHQEACLLDLHPKDPPTHAFGLGVKIKWIEKIERAFRTLRAGLGSRQF